MSGHDSYNCLKLHMPPSKACTLQEAAGDFDFAWYAPIGMGIAWLGHHVVGVVNVENDVSEGTSETVTALRSFVTRHAGRSDNDTVMLTERGRVEANLLHAQRGADGSSDTV